MYKIYIFEQLELVKKDFIERAIVLLPTERRKKALKYRKVVDRNNCVITYLMLKVALRESFQIEKFTIKCGEYGKPYLSEYPKVYFNISHCARGCVVAVADVPIGVDIQEVRSISTSIKEYFCTATEQEKLKACNNTDVELIKIWVAKECYGKMRGVGVNYPMKDKMAVDMEQVSVAKTKHGNMVGICVHNSFLEKKD